MKPMCRCLMCCVTFVIGKWAEDIPMLEGHQGSCICGKCLSIAFTEVMLHKSASAPAEYTCPMCLEGSSDRAELGRADEPGWQSPMYPEAVVCRRCIKLAAGALHKDTAFDWSKPTIE